MKTGWFNFQELTDLSEYSKDSYGSMMMMVIHPFRRSSIWLSSSEAHTKLWSDVPTPIKITSRRRMGLQRMGK
jgi:hypothetical protein